MNNYTDVCALNDIAPDTGVCALINGKQIAIFRPINSTEVYAMSNLDPIGKANVLSRGIISEIKGQLTIASPLYKQHYALKTGQCLEEDIVIDTYPTQIKNDRVYINA